MVKFSFMLFNKEKNVWLNEVLVFIFFFVFFYGVVKNNNYYRIVIYFKV